MRGLLSEVRILDLTRMLAGPYGSMLLGDLGAEVIKIEPPTGDEIRRMGPPFIRDQSAYFMSINRNKKSLTLDLKSEKGRRLFYRLVGVSDVVLDNFRPGVLEKLGCNYEVVRDYNPRIISCSITSFGEEGPMKDLPAFDLIIQAFSGAMGITGEPDRPPVRMGIPLGDLAGSIFAAYAISAGLFRRERTGEGCKISLSLLDCLVSLLTYVAGYYFADGKVPQPQGSRHMSCVPYGAYRTKDMYIVVGVFTERFWENFCKVINRPDLVDDPRFNSNEGRVRNRQVLEPLLEEIFARRSAEEWLNELYAQGVPAAPVNTLERVFLMPQLLMRGMVVELDHPVAGLTKGLGCPIKVNGVQPHYLASPLLGQHNLEVLGGLLGMSNEQIDRLKEEGVV